MEVLDIGTKVYFSDYEGQILQITISAGYRIIYHIGYWKKNGEYQLFDFQFTTKCENNKQKIGFK